MFRRGSRGADFLTPVVYTMGKVASTSVAGAIRDAGLPCYGIHSLAPEYLRKTAQDWLARDAFPPRHICVSMAYRDRLFVHGEKCLYISLVRDPIARNISAFFQNLYLRPEQIRDENDPQSMFEIFKQSYNHSLPITWFDREFKDQLGIDVFEHPFDHAKKYVHIESKNVILFRLDCPDAVKARVLSRALGRKIKIRRQNDSDNKGYAKLYKRVKEEACFSPDFVDEIYASKFARHFWSEEELRNMSAEWKNGRGRVSAP